MKSYEFAFRMKPKFFVAAPFGNYLQPQGTIPVTGTWTLEPRGSRVWSVMKSLRWNSSQSGCTNK